jgi:hypothetical protein
MSEYTKLKSSGMKRGRPRLAEDERMQRKEVVAMRAESRRRAMIVISRKHQAEFDAQVEEEFRQMKRDQRKK